MRILLIAILFAVKLNAAVTAATVWEFRLAGTATSGGGFDSTIAGAGTDMSLFDNKNAAACSSCQSATVNISTVDAVTNNTTTVTSATANFSSALIGNTIRLSGTGTTTGWYQVTAVGSATSITVDRATGSTGGTGVTLNIGGAIGGNGNDLDAIELASPNGIQAGNTVWVRAGAWTITATATFNQSGTAGNPISYIGYTATRGDNGMVTVQRASGATVTNFSTTGAFRRWINFHADCNAVSGTTTGFSSATNGNHNFIRVRASNCTIAGISASLNSTIFDAYVTGMVSGATGAFVVSGSSANVVIVNAVADNNATHGFANTSTAGTRTMCLRCISSNNTGSGFMSNNANQWNLQNSVAYDNGGDGVLFDNSSVATAGDATVILNSIFYSNGGRGINSNTVNFGANGQFSLVISNNAFGDNTSGSYNNVPVGTGDVTLSANPFVDGEALNFALNNTAGGGAAVKGVGFPGTLLFGGTGFTDMGALQSQGGAGGGQVGYTFIAGLLGQEITLPPVGVIFLLCLLALIYYYVSKRE